MNTNQERKKIDRQIDYASEREREVQKTEREERECGGRKRMKEINRSRKRERKKEIARVDLVSIRKERGEGVWLRVAGPVSETLPFPSIKALHKPI